MQPLTIPRDDGRWKWVEKKATELAYGGTLTRFVAAGLRSLSRGSGRCRLPLSENLKEAALNLLKALKDHGAGSSPSGPLHIPTDWPDVFEDQVEAEVPTSAVGPKPDVLASPVRELQEYFFLSVTSMVEVAKDKKFQCPVQVYLACFGYNNDDTFKTPSEVTSQLANWQYLLRCTALFQVNLLSKLEKVGSILTWVPSSLCFRLVTHHYVDIDHLRITARST